MPNITVPIFKVNSFRKSFMDIFNFGNDFFGFGKRNFLSGSHAYIFKCKSHTDVLYHFPFQITSFEIWKAENFL